MKFLYALLPLAALLSFSSCSEEEEPCDPAKEEALARREAELDRREADLLARERALGGRSGNSSGAADAAYSTGARTNDADDNGYATAAGRNNNRYNAKSRPIPVPEEQRVGYRKAVYFPGQYPEASERTLTSSDLEYKSAWGKKVMLNEIYARYGLTFNEPDLRKHFNGESWYKGGKKNVDAKLTAVERQNIALIKASM